MLHLDLKYVNMLVNHFERFERKSDYLFNVRCPICGDSQQKKTKMRGYIYRVKQRMAYKCHNCNVSMGFGNLLKHMNHMLHKEWTLEVLKETKPGLFRLKELLEKPGFFDQTPVRFGKIDQPIYQHAERVSDLPEHHMCQKYVKDRGIPREYWHRLYFAPSYKEFVDEVAPGHGKIIHGDSRLVIPYYDMYGEVIAVTGRDLVGSVNSIRYITVRTNKDESKLVYGLDRVNQSEPVYVVEGPLDSLFLKNAVASGDANLVQVAEKLAAANITLVYDNEPRNKEIVQQMKKAIQKNYKICVWPNWIKEKDINDMIRANYSADALHTIIHDNTHKGIAALAHWTSWKKV